MNLENTFRKVFEMLDSSVAGERESALHQLRTLMEKRADAPRSFRELLAEIDVLETNIPLAAYQKLEKDFDETATVINQLSADYDSLLRKYRAINAGRTALLWLQMNWKRCASAAVLLAAAGGGFAYWDRQAHADERNAVDAQLAKVLGGMAAQANLAYTGDYSSSSVVNIGGKPYWAMLYGSTEKGSYTDANGRPITLLCAHLVAEAAERLSFAAGAAAAQGSDNRAVPGAYRAPRPFNALGWLRWPERAVNCRVITDDPKQRTDGNGRQIGNSGPTEIPDAGIVEEPHHRFDRLFRQRG